MAVIVWSKQSLGDVDAIAAYIKRDSHFYAKAVVDKFISTAEAILLFPKVGRIVPELNDDLIRERFVYSYRLIYQINDSHIEILAVIHGKRMLDIADISAK
jgi:plasmid stabilization system protein ParE